jgi:hypothetical protein
MWFWVRCSGAVGPRAPLLAAHVCANSILEQLTLFLFLLLE